MDTGRLDDNQGEGERCRRRQMRSDSGSVLDTPWPFGHHMRLLAEPSGTSAHPSLELVVLT